MCKYFESVNNEIPRMLLTKIEESNASIGQQQMDNISSTLTLIKNPRQENGANADL